VKKHYDWLVVGAGFTGAVAAERLAAAGKRVLVVDRRPHVAGNAYDELDEHGILVHRYGPHIFHTNSARVFEYLSQFTTWRPYEHHVQAVLDGQFVPLPFNLNTIDALFKPAEAERLTRLLIERYGEGKKAPVLKMREDADPEVRKLGEFVYEKVFHNYTVKQWDLTPDQLDPAVTARVPVLVGRDDRYFQDEFQAMPAEGYTALFSRMLDHPNIDLALATEWRDAAEQVSFDRVVFTGPIDEYFGYAHGALPYRSLRFEFRHEAVERFQPVGTVNYPNDHAYTRITEQKVLSGQEGPGTTLVYEYPQAYEPGVNDPYYPIPTPETAEAVRPYLEEARRLEGRVWFAGRLGDYAYYNMDQACGRALALFEKQLAGA